MALCHLEINILFLLCLESFTGQKAIYKNYQLLN